MINRIILNTCLLFLMLCCHKPEIQYWVPPSPQAFPHNWLRKPDAIESIENNSTFKKWSKHNHNRWEQFKARLKPGDEIWYWETDPFNYNEAFTGYCIIRQSKVVEVFFHTRIMWLDNISEP